MAGNEVTRFTSVRRTDGNAAAFAREVDDLLVVLQQRGARIRRLDPHFVSGPDRDVMTMYVSYCEPASGGEDAEHDRRRGPSVPTITDREAI